MFRVYGKYYQELWEALLKPSQKRIYRPPADFGFVVVCLVSLVWYDHTIELKLNKIHSFLSLYLPSSGCTASTELDIRHEVVQIKANVFYSTFMNSFSCHVLRTFNILKIFFLERCFYIYAMHNWHILQCIMQCVD